MASPTPSTSNGSDDAHAQTTESAFAMQWQPADTSSLQPANLSLSRAPRAWERKPLSPFSRSKMRVGKVWKRSAPVEIRQRRSVGGAGGKPIKKMRLDGGASVARWEGEGEDDIVASPARKIVLRRDRVGEEGLTALPDEDEETVEVDGEDDAIVEVFDEEGTLLQVDHDEPQEWEDEDADEFNPTMMHLGDIMEQAQQDASSKAPPLPGESPDQETVEHRLPTADSTSPLDLDQELPSAVNPTQQDGPPTPMEPTREEVVLPQGFVSPVRGQAPTGPRSARKSFGSRRRTLPTEWRPSRLRQVTNADEEENDDDPTHPGEPILAEVDQVSHEPEATMSEERADPVVEQATEQEWEDVTNEPEAELDADMGDVSAGERIDEDCGFSETSSALQQVSETESEESITEAVRHASPTKLPPSPIPSIEGRHPRLPLRRSPRRKSSSPVKQRAIRPSTEQSHLVAFTPIKGLQRLSAFTASPIIGELPNEDETEDATPPLLERSVSAPPEEPAMSPHRPSRPRVSDDTALLQAFLNRAAETKSSGRRVSVTKRESMTNRRDSGAVRQALASPAKPEVLADLDPNSPSPRKTTIASDEVDDANILPDPEPSPLHKTRRSGRATKKAAPQTATPAAALNKISIRGNSENVVLKKTEAQEVSQLTRTNTRKNKGGAILPLYRLAKLQQQGIIDPLDDGTTIEEEAVSKPNSKGRALRWNETLVEFWQGGDVSETSLLSDELNSSTPAPSTTDQTEAEAEVPASSGPPPPAETPSKPKIRRLKASRTAATPAKAVAAPIDDTATADGAEKPESAAPSQVKAPAPTKRRSRIATPAKGLGNSSLLPADLEPTPAPIPAPPSQQKKSIPAPSTTTGRRRAPASKLPAPASSITALSSSTMSTNTSALGQGKENLISSPPKKKPGPGTGMPSAKTFAPKLDFGKSLAPSIGSQDEGLPGLASPAKKVGRKGGVRFAPSTSAGNGGSQEEPQGREEIPMGLRSPAKKRTRRGAAGS